MTNLTEQWKKGELPEGDYYLDIGSDTIIDYWVCNHWNWTEYDSRIKAVLCEVPTYDEYQQLLSDQLAKDEGVEINAELKEENAKLKDLLKGAREVLKMVDTYCGDYDSINGFLIVEKINQALGEE